MRTRHFLLAALLSFAILVMSDGMFAAALNTNYDGPGVPVKTVVTVVPRHGGKAPVIHKEDVVVRQGHYRAPVISWVLAQGRQAGMQLLLLLDDSARMSMGSQFGVLREFINQQPPSTLIGVGYMHNGTVDMAQDFTADRIAASNALHLPFGAAGGTASPYFSITEMCKQWQANPAYPRREVVLISNGVDTYDSRDSQNPYVSEAIEDVQRAGIQVFAIYTPGAGAGRPGAGNWGQTYLDELSGQSGGNAYGLGLGLTADYAPGLSAVANILNHQYLLTFSAQPEKKAGMQKLKITTEVVNAKLVAPDQLYVPGKPD